jgi:hypothetical protein
MQSFYIFSLPAVPLAIFEFEDQRRIPNCARVCARRSPFLLALGQTEEIRKSGDLLR